MSRRKLKMLELEKAKETRATDLQLMQQQLVPSEPTQPQLFNTDFDLSDDLDWVKTISEHVLTPEALFEAFTAPIDPFHDLRRIDVLKYHVHQSLSSSEIMDAYYQNFHYRHPFLPPREQLQLYIGYAPELLAVMGLTVGVLSSFQLMSFQDTEHLVKDIQEKLRKAVPDLIKLQTMVLLSIVSHMSGMTDVSLSMIKCSSDVCYRSFSAYIRNQGGLSHEDCANILSSWRTVSLNMVEYQEALAKVAHEVYFMDTFSSMITGQKFSPFVSDSQLISLVEAEDVPGFAFKTRFRTITLIKEMIGTFNSFEAGTVKTDFQRLNNVVTTFEQLLKGAMTIEARVGFSPSDLVPKLVSEYGIVDDGIYQSIMSLYLAMIVMHFPLSCIATPSVHCPGRMSHATFIATELLLPAPRERSQALNAYLQNRLSTLKCVYAAKVLISLVSTLGVDVAVKRTPLYSCCLIIAGAIQLRSLSFLKSIEGRRDFEQEEIDYHHVHVKLSMEAFKGFAQHWRKADSMATTFQEAAINEMMDDRSNRADDYAIAV